MENEMEQMKLRSELSMRNVDIANTSRIMELKNTITRLPNKVSIDKVQWESDVRHYNKLKQ